MLVWGLVLLVALGEGAGRLDSLVDQLGDSVGSLHQSLVDGDNSLLAGVPADIEKFGLDKFAPRVEPEGVVKYWVREIEHHRRLEDPPGDAERMAREKREAEERAAADKAKAAAAAAAAKAEAAAGIGGMAMKTINANRERAKALQAKKAKEAKAKAEADAAKAREDQIEAWDKAENKIKAQKSAYAERDSKWWKVNGPTLKSYTSPKEYLWADKKKPKEEVKKIFPWDAPPAE